jgi:hypothetical protein
MAVIVFTDPLQRTRCYHLATKREAKTGRGDGAASVFRTKAVQPATARGPNACRDFGSRWDLRRRKTAAARTAAAEPFQPPGGL